MLSLHNQTDYTMRYVKIFLLTIWQMPQSFIGLLYLLLLLATGNKRCMYITYSKLSIPIITVQTKIAGGSVSLGMFVFISPAASAVTEVHELGHTVQSVYLGPLYLIAIGIPSFIWAATHRLILPKVSYYDFYTERWADSIAGIHRTKYL